MSFGHIAFFGMGASTAGILIVKLGWPWLPASLVGGVGAVVLALVIGWPCLRLKGPYFAIAMLGLNEVLRVAVSYFEGLTGGGSGLSLPALYASVPIYYAMGLVALAVTGLAYVIVTSRFGLRLIGRTFQVIRVFPELTALENLLVVTTNDYAAARARAEELLGFVKLTGLAGEFAGNLSYGQQKLVEFVACS